MISDHGNAIEGGEEGEGGGDGVGGYGAGSEGRRGGGGGDEDALPVHNWRQRGGKQHLYEAREGTCMEWRSVRAALSLSSRLPPPPPTSPPLPPPPSPPPLWIVCLWKSLRGAGMCTSFACLLCEM